MTQRQIFCRGDATDPNNARWYELLPDGRKKQLQLSSVCMTVEPGKHTVAVIQELDRYGERHAKQHVHVVEDPAKSREYAPDGAYVFELQEHESHAHDATVLEMTARQVKPDGLTGRLVACEGDRDLHCRQELNRWMMSTTKDPHGFKVDRIRDMGARMGEMIAAEMIAKMERTGGTVERYVPWTPPDLDEARRLDEERMRREFERAMQMMPPESNKLGGKYKAVMDDRPCPDCKGKGKYTGFTSVEECTRCGGTGKA